LHSDLHFMGRLYPHPLPAVLGHESAGVVEQVGADVTYVNPRSCRDVPVGILRHLRQLLDRAAGALHRYHGEDAAGVSNRLSWRDRKKLNQFLNLSSFAEQMLVHENAIAKSARTCR